MIIFLLCFLTQADLNVTKVPRTGFPPSPRTQQAAVYSEYLNSLIIFGGKDGLDLFNDIWTYNFTTSLWTCMENLIETFPGKCYIEKRRSAAIFLSASLDFVVYIYGGVGINGPLNDLWSFNLASSTWNLEKIYSDFFPLVSFAYDAFTRNNLDYLCIFGGIDVDRYSNQLHM